jgi:hypothetical protein
MMPNLAQFSEDLFMTSLFSSFLRGPTKKMHLIEFNAGRAEDLIGFLMA